MILNIYNVKDALTGFKEHIFTSVNDAEAVRSFTVAALSAGSYVNTYAKDIDLYRIGNLDTKTGKITGIEEGPEFITNAKVIIKEAEKENEIRKPIQQN